MKLLLRLLTGLACVFAAGCATKAPKDYTEFRKSHPRSILVLPPVNESPDVRASYSVLTTTTRPIAELGSYVFPVVLVDQFMKENGLTVPGEMHAAPLAKLREVFGADAVLYLTVENYGSKYQVISSTTLVHLRAKLVDARTATVLWEGAVKANDGGQGGLIEAVVQQVMSNLLDRPHMVAFMASAQLLMPPDQGLLKGPRHPEAAQE
jgi:hypothetical protein